MILKHILNATGVEVFHSLLARRRAALCDHLDRQAERLARHERNRDSAGVRRKRLRIKEIGAEIRDIDRMVQRLTAQLIGEAQKHR
jgi:DNA-binding ferritin-like protein